MSVNDIIDNNVDKKKVKESKDSVSWETLVEQNRLSKLYSVAEQVCLLAIEWGIDPSDVEEQLLKPLGPLVVSACKELVDSVKE